MSRKDYILIADALNEIHGKVGSAMGDIAFRQNVIYPIADMLAKDNPRFDYYKFTERAEKGVIHRCRS